MSVKVNKISSNWNESFDDIFMNFSKTCDNNVDWAILNVHCGYYKKRNRMKGTSMLIFITSCEWHCVLSAAISTKKLNTF